MPNPKLQAIVTAIDEWCIEHRVKYDITTDESDLQGIKLFEHNRTLINDIIDYLYPLLESYGIHCNKTKVRGGTVLSLSLEALNESIIEKKIIDSGEEIMQPTFEDRVADALLAPPPKKIINPPTINIDEQAKRIAEAQYKTAIRGAARANQTSRNRQAITRNDTYSGSEKKPKKKKTTQFESRIGEVFKSPNYNESEFNKTLEEALDGMATPNGAQPQELFAKFAKALEVLGTNLHIGPLQDRLKEQGINWKKSDDGQSVILYVVNAATKAPQPLARVSAETLESPQDFEEQLSSMIDFSKGDAPGTTKQKQEEIRNTEKTIRDISQSVAPPKPQEGNEIEQQMGMGTQQAQAGAAVAAQAPAVPTEQQPLQTQKPRLTPR